MLRGLSVGVVALLGLSLAAAPAGAKMRATRDAMKVAKPMVPKRYLKKADFSVLPPDSHPAVKSTTKLAGFPRSGKAFTILSNGNSLFAKRPNLSESTSFLTRGPIIRGSRDVIILRLTLKVPKNRNCLSFNFKFLSEEFPEFVGVEFNDAFIAELNPSTWFSERDDPAIASPNNFARDSDDNPIRVNEIGGTTAVKPSYAKGTTYDAATRTLRASTNVTPGKRRALYLSIFDQGDRQYDSAVFLDKLRIKKDGNCVNGVVVDE